MRSLRCSVAAGLVLAALVLSTGLGAYPHHHAASRPDAVARCGPSAPECTCPQDHLRRARAADTVDDCAICFLQRLVAGGPTTGQGPASTPSCEIRRAPAAGVVLEFSLASWIEARAPPTT